MCGDGANDCGALKAAAVGISLSEAEASIAAPFTSKIQNISCVVTLLREGKAALATSFQSFKFIELYSIIQLTTCVMLYSIGSNITDMQFLYIDLVALIPLSVLQAWTGSHSELTADMPTATLFYCPVLFSVICSSLIQVSFQLFFFINVKKQPFYEPINAEEISFDEPNPSYENTVLFMVANFQYLVTCIAFSVSKPFRKSLWTNKAFTVSIALLILLGSLCVFLPDGSGLSSVFDMLPFEAEDGTSYYDYRAWITVGILVNTLLTLTAEKILARTITSA